MNQTNRNTQDPFSREPSFFQGHESGAGAEVRYGKPFLRTRKKLALLLTACLLLSCGAGFGGAVAARYFLPEKSSRLSDSARFAPSDSSAASPTAGAGALSIAQVAAMNADSIVEIRTERVSYDFWMQQYVVQGAGSGVIISRDGFIVTNQHVISNAKKITVTLRGGESYDAVPAGADPSTDIAVIRIRAGDLTPVVYGNSDALQAGEPAIVMGNPLGHLGGSVSSGIISALDRPFTIKGRQVSLLQTDASVNPGNSGGGLFNSRGELVGLVVAKNSGSGVEGLGFAIPVNLVRDISSQLMENGFVRGRPALGLRIQDLSSAPAALSAGVQVPGVYVRGVDGANAVRAGFREGDLLYALNGSRITGSEALFSLLQKYSPGDTVEVTVVRNGEKQTLSAVLDEQS